MVIYLFRQRKFELKFARQASESSTHFSTSDRKLSNLGAKKCLSLFSSEGSNIGFLHLNERTTKNALKLSLQKLQGGFCGFSPPSGFRCCEHFGKKVVNMFIHNLGVADLDPISKSNFDPFL